jgi:hypothetical protein
LGAQGLPGAQGLSEDFFFFFLAGPQGFPGAQGFVAALAALALAAGASAAIAAGAAATMALATNSADNLSANLLRFFCDFIILNSS